VQLVSLSRVKKWFAGARLEIKEIKWMATPRFERIVERHPEFFGSMFGAEIIALGRAVDG
jgi:hypothetical protein